MTDTTTEAVESAWEEYEASAKPCGNDGDMEFYNVDGMMDEAHNLYTIAKAIAAERDTLRAQNIELQFALAETEALELQHGAVIESLRAQLIDAQAQAQTARDALDDITGVGFDMPATLELSDAEWSRRRASIMQQIARAALIQPTPTTPALRALSKETDDDNA